MTTSEEEELAKEEEAEEIKIPVLSVLKKGTVIKHIFFNTPPFPISLEFDGEEEDAIPIKIGRHPNCHVVLDHPSISRFHLEIRSRPFSQQLSVTDLSSVHGSWISGRKIEPGVPSKLVDGDTLRLGASTRVYRLRWVHQSKASEELENPLEALPEEKEENHQEERLAEMMEILKGNWGFEGPSAPPMPGSFARSTADDDFGLLESQRSSPRIMDGEDEYSARVPALELTLERQVKEFKCSSLLSRRSKTIGFLTIPGRDQERRPAISEDQIVKELKKGEIAEFGSEFRCAAKASTSDKDIFDLGKENSAPEFLLENFPSYIEGDEVSNLECCDQKLKIYARDEETKNLVEEEMVLMKNLNQTCDRNEVSAPAGDEYSSFTEILDKREIIDKSQESMRYAGEVTSLGLKDLKLSEKNLTEEEEEEEEDIFASDKENMTPDVSSYSCKSSKLCSLCIEDWTPKHGEYIMKSEKEESVFDSDKENLTPQTSTGQNLETPSVSLMYRNMANSARDDWTPKHECRMKNEKEELVFGVDKENLLQLSLGRKLKKKGYLTCSNLKETSSLSVASQVMVNSDRVVLTPQHEHNTKSEKEEFDFDKENFMLQLSSRQKLELKRGQPTCNKENWAPKHECYTKSKKEELIVDSDKENSSPQMASRQKVEKKQGQPICNKIWTPKYEKCSTKSEKKEKVFDSDRENFMQQMVSARTIEKRGQTTCNQERWTPKVPSNEKVNKLLAESSENGQPDSSLGAQKSSDTFKVKEEDEFEIFARKRTERIPLHPLMENSPIRCGSIRNELQKMDKDRKGCSSLRRNLCHNNSFALLDESNGSPQKQSSVSQGLQEKEEEEEKRKKWHIVVDTSCFLSEESRRALQLLEGLKGTNLIIPRMVIRELDYMKRQECWYKQKGKKISSALQWIRDCMVNSSWWIHVQSSSEITPVPETPPPPASSPTVPLFGEGTGNNNFTPKFSVFSSDRGLMEVLSPTPDDHILDCALLFRTLRTDGWIILLSENVTLKIKAMAEGMLCETPAEFHESLVNPFSRRFLWSKSSPRGPTWSFSDEIGFAREKKTSRLCESAKGLKLILLHNSQYRLRSSDS